MNNDAVANTFFEESIRFEQIIHIASMCIDYAWPSEVEESIKDDWENISKEIGLPFPDNIIDDKEELFSNLYSNDKMGFLIKVASPIPTTFDTNGGYTTGGWGFYQTAWIYVDEFSEAFPIAIKWKESMIEKRRGES